MALVEVSLPLSPPILAPCLGLGLGGSVHCRARRRLIWERVDLCFFFGWGVTRRMQAAKKDPVHHALRALLKKHSYKELLRAVVTASERHGAARGAVFFCSGDSTTAFHHDRLPQYLRRGSRSQTLPRPTRAFTSCR